MYFKLSVFCFILISFAANFSLSQTDQDQTGSGYDSSYAQKLGADDYGMKTYVMAFLRSGEVSSENKEESQRLQMEHLKNIIRLAEEGVLEMELIPWYGSAALMELNNIHKKIQKISITDQ